jgi:ATP-binding protein involved in chromosome partitioning
MSYYKCPSCGHKEHLFGEEGARRTADEMDMEFLGEVRVDAFRVLLEILRFRSF